MKRLVASALSLAMILPGGITPYVHAAEAVSLKGVDVAADQVTLRLSDRAKYNTFMIAEPPRLVVELLDVEHSLSNKIQEGQGRFLKRVRSGQHQQKPNLITRIVLDLVKVVAYHSAWSGNDLLVSLKPDALAADKETDSMDLPKEHSTSTSGELNDIAANSSVAGNPPDSATEKAPRKSASSIPSFNVKDRKDILAGLSREPVTLDFDSTDIREILRLLGAKARINIVYGTDVTGVMTLHLSDVPFNEAFTTILSMQGLVANQAGDNILRVMTPATLQKERAVSVNTTRVIRLKYSKADDIRPAIDQVRQAEMRTGKLVTDPNTNSLIITDTLDGIASVERLLSQLDIRPQQLLIEAKLVEVKLSKGINFGIQWDYFGIDYGKALGKQGISTLGTTTGLPSLFDTKNLMATSAANPLTFSQSGTNQAIGSAGRGTGVNLPADKVFGAFTFGRITNNYFLSATLTAAASEGKVKVLSDPKITTLNGKKASINITTQIPYVTSNVASTGVTSNNVSYVTTGIQLDVTPTVNADGRVTLDVSPNVSQPSATAAANTQSGAPAIDSRIAHTIVLVQDGETIVIGGLITDSVSNTISKIPLLGDIPILGWLFKKKSVQRDRVELLIFVTTKLVPN